MLCSLTCDLELALYILSINDILRALSGINHLQYQSAQSANEHVRWVGLMEHAYI